ncbi:MAG: S-layer homology domain-containing protein [Candidatus Limnocylindrales bacterium]
MTYQPGTNPVHDRFGNQAAALTDMPAPNYSDSTDPETTITGGPATRTSTAAADITFASNETAALFECRLDFGGSEPCESTFIVRDLVKGQHTFSVRAIDAAGNVDESPAELAWSVVCLTPPFSDVATSHPFCAEIEWMKDQNISTDFADGTYGPSRNVTRQAMSPSWLASPGPASSRAKHRRSPMSGCSSILQGDRVDEELGHLHRVRRRDL